MSSMSDKLDAFFQMAIDAMTQDCWACSLEANVDCPECGGTGDIVPKPTGANVAGVVFATAVKEAYVRQQAGDLGTLEEILMWCSRYAQEIQRAALEECARGGVSQEDAVRTAVSDIAKRSKARRAAEEPNAGAMTPEEIEDLWKA